MSAQPSIAEIIGAKAVKVTGFKSAPGMPVEVHIDTGAQTFFDYVAKSVTDSISHEFREG